jgi:hypothetical protein
MRLIGICRLCNDKDGTNLMLFGCAGENEPAVERVQNLSVEAQAGDRWLMCACAICGAGFVQYNSRLDQCKQGDGTMVGWCCFIP